MSNQLAIVTGASSGIGLELAKEFASHGYDLLVCAEDDSIHRVQDQVDASVDVRSVQSDLRTRAGVEELYREITATGRAVDALALNAGVG